MGEKVNPDIDEEQFSGFNFFFKGMVGDPVHIGNVIETLINNTTKWPAGANIGIDHDATYDSARVYEVSDTDALMPQLSVDDLRGYDGGEYESKEERTAEFIANLEAEAAE